MERGGRVYEQDTSNIGKRPAAKPAPTPEETALRIAPGAPKPGEVDPLHPLDGHRRQDGQDAATAGILAVGVTGDVKLAPARLPIPGGMGS